jgi:hypothetical protein
MFFTVSNTPKNIWIPSKCRLLTSRFHCRRRFLLLVFNRVLGSIMFFLHFWRVQSAGDFTSQIGRQINTSLCLSLLRCLSGLQSALGLVKDSLNYHGLKHIKKYLDSFKNCRKTSLSTRFTPQITTLYLEGLTGNVGGNVGSRPMKLLRKSDGQLCCKTYTQFSQEVCRHLSSIPDKLLIEQKPWSPSTRCYRN